MIKKMNLKNKILVGLLGGSLAFVPGAFAKSSVDNPQSSFGVDYTFIDSDMQEGNKVDLNGSLVTDYGIFNLGFSETLGKQRIDPHKTNVVTNGTTPRDFYNLMDGKIQEISLGWGAKKEVLDDLLVGLKIGGKIGEGETDKGPETIGYQKQSGNGFLVGLSLTDLDENGLKTSYSQKNVEERVTFVGSSSNEKITSETYFVGYQIGLMNGKLQITPSYTLEKENSDLTFKPFGLNREVEHTKRIPGIEAKILDNNEDYIALSLGLIQGEQRHEFTSANTSGYKIGIERLNEGLKLWLNGSYEDNSSNSSLSTIDPNTMVPVELLLDEKRKNININGGFSNSKLEFNMNYDVEDKSGVNDVFIPSFNVTMPLANAESIYKTLSGELGLNINENGKLNIHAQKEFEHDGFEAGLGYTKRF
ncbi:MAG: hypothetical protein PF569_02025 [Candidatus Woesearchaeota archaeon]|jgi:hypothetical protein|nr:hypothetical protein [Candidatus Woesearchaeota archaeon]